MIDAIVAWIRQPRWVSAGAFVVLAIALTLGVQALLRGGGDDGGGGVPVPRIVGPGAAPAASQRVTQAHVHGTGQDAQAVAAAASGATGSALTPLAPADFAAPIARYRVYARGEARTLGARTAALSRALRAGDRARSRAAWQSAASAWRRVGAAYGALGSLGEAIDGGLGRVEDGLWGHASPRALAAPAATLAASVATLRGRLGRSAITPLDYATRAHEILEDVQRDALGAGGPSASGVRATADGVAATRVVLGTLGDVLAGRGDALTQSRFWLARLAGTVARIRAAHGGAYPTVSALSRAERERLQGRLGATLEALRGIPGELETTLPPKVARLPR
jgi:high-affinity iron transporter